jgi:hypothetical protein
VRADELQPNRLKTPEPRPSAMLISQAPRRRNLTRNSIVAPNGRIEIESDTASRLRQANTQCGAFALERYYGERSTAAT